MAVDYDLVVIGDTIAGRWAALTAARQQARVALVVPPSVTQPAVAPHLILRELGYKARQAQQMPALRGETLAADPASLMALNPVCQWVDSILEPLAESDSSALLARAGVDRVVGPAQFQTMPKLQVAVAERHLQARAYLLAIEPEPEPPQIPGLETGAYLTPHRILSQLQAKAKPWPDNAVVLGAGPTAVELSQTLAQLGSQVTLLTRHAQILPHEDPEAAFLVQAHLEAAGLRILTNTQVTAVNPSADGSTQVVTMDTSLHTQAILWTPEQPSRIIPIDIDALDLKFTRHGLWVNSKLQTTAPYIYACGAILGGYALPHVARHEANIALKNALSRPRWMVDYHHIPWAIFADPELARVGLTEPQAKRRYQTVHVLRQYYKTVARAHIQGETTGFCKLLIHPKGHILGAHLVGAGAADLIHLIAFAMQHRCRVNSLADLVYISPTLSEITFHTAAEWQIPPRPR